MGHFAPTINPLPIVIGGTSAGAGNVIVGSQTGSGISLSEPSEFNVANSIQGNFIGTDRTGLARLGNILGGGIILGAVRNVTITGNTIAYNAQDFNSAINIPSARRAF